MAFKGQPTLEVKQQEHEAFPSLGRWFFTRHGGINSPKNRLTNNISEITEIGMKLTPIMEKFILHWGEMGWRWGINRSVAQVHALLMLSPKPLAADEICASLNVARSNVSNSIKELQSWGLVRVVHVFGDRREHFETLKDVWEMFLIILRERKKREIEPTLQTLRECAAEAEKAMEGTDYTQQRLSELIEFMELSSSWADKAQALSPTAAKRLCQLGDKVFRLVG
jgi:DNA-binding transcriptional regulator GbsR (MarR family)